ncbi:MAG TPA: N-acetylmuramoyl-L-alanine amidase [Bryobacteraceae bacterium]|nr:N-acetylmuramoyl-L-alanine amidase [Bryobacteraceae bacterium]
MRHLPALAIFVSLAPAGILHAQMRSVTGVRHWQLGDVTRVAVEVSGGFQYRSDRLHNPERVYFDILSARPLIESRRIYTEAVSEGLLKRIRVAETTPGTTRIVLELADNVEATPSVLINPSRLIIELHPAEAPSAPVLSEIPETKAPLIPVPPAQLPPPPKLVAADAAPVALPIAPPVLPPAPPRPPEPAPIQSTPARPLEKAKSAKLNTAGETSMVRALGLKINRIVIDPGHGGHDEGTMGPKGLVEKDLVLDVAQRLGKLVEQRMGAEVIYTRTDDTFIPLEGRTELANDKKADLFLSIHANSSPAAPRVTGIETYYLNFTQSKDALEVAARENATSDRSVFELHDLVQKITLQEKVEESREFAERLQASLFSLSARNFPGEKNRGVRKAPFVVLIGANMPSVLAEIGFLTNPKEESLLRRPDYRQKVAEALYRGISRYADGLSHFQVAKN